MIKFLSIISFSLLSQLLFASDIILYELAPNEEKQLTNIGKKASEQVLQTLMKTMLADIKSTGLAQAAHGWSKSVNIINGIADSYEIGMTIKRPTYQYRNPINKPDDIDKVALDYFLSDKSEDALSFSRKFVEKNTKHYRYYQPIYVTQKCLLCHSSKISEDVKAVLKEKYPGDRSNNLKLGQLRALIRVELPESAIAKVNNK